MFGQPDRQVDNIDQCVHEGCQSMILFDVNLGNGACQIPIRCAKENLIQTSGI